MYSHTTVGANDVNRAKAFYDVVLAPLGIEAKLVFDSAISYGLPGGPSQFWVTQPFDGKSQSVGNGTMIAFAASKRSAVDACYAAAMARGGKDEGGPGLRPHYHKDYYGAYFRDLDGNKICVCSQHAE
ncbi:VOC family protein [Microvirga terricola]|uniref:VOC family protein n=1 Tax=Microvirga terricola TaxID=2719797 RepID=A0ABX0VAV4_9HYPH|nr:VOC family protein [Microvirga terricola]NIX76964.1 VOC family protein [Microvirga terricola]